MIKLFNIEEFYESDYEQVLRLDALCPLCTVVHSGYALKGEGC